MIQTEYQMTWRTLRWTRRSTLLHPLWFMRNAQYAVELGLSVQRERRGAMCNGVDIGHWLQTQMSPSRTSWPIHDCEDCDGAGGSAVGSYPTCDDTFGEVVGRGAAEGYNIRSLKLGTMFRVSRPYTQDGWSRKGGELCRIGTEDSVS